MNLYLKLSHFHYLPHALLALFLLLAACARTPPVTHYSLSAIDPDQPVVGGEALGEAVIGIGPVRLSEYLDRPQIVTREGANLLHLAEGNRWVEPLAVSIPRTMRENLATALDTEKILVFPWTQEVDYQILVEIVRFEGVDSTTAYLEAIWSAQDSQGKLILPQRRSEYRVPMAESDSEGLVRALSRALALFSWEIAEKLSGTASGK